jgi:hypothetical protein
MRFWELTNPLHSLTELLLKKVTDLVLLKGDKTMLTRRYHLRSADDNKLEVLRKRHSYNEFLGDTFGPSLLTPLSDIDSKVDLKRLGKKKSHGAKM